MFIRHDADGTDTVLSSPACESPSGDDGNGLALVQADTAAEEHDGSVTTAGAAATPSSELENTLAFKEELAFFWEEQTEASEVDLLLVDFHLGEVGIISEIENESFCYAVLEVEAGIAVEVVRNGGFHALFGGDTRNSVGLDFQVFRTSRCLQAHQSGCRGNFGYAAEAVGRGDGSKVGELVLPAHDASEVDSPDLGAPFFVAQRLEGDGHLHRPAVL